jgi:PEP-CTERM/exosortase A-associated glycosyltransferase
MRILHILDHSLPLQSGYVYRTLGIVNQQRALGWEPILLTSGKHYASGPAREHIEGWEFFRTDPPTGIGAQWGGIGELKIVSDLRRRLGEVAREVRPDILHAHSPVLNGLSAIRYARRLRLPVVYEVRAFWEDAWLSMHPQHRAAFRYYATRHLETYVMRRADAVVVICQGLADEVARRGISADKITVVPNAVDRRSFTGAGIRDPELEARLGLAGRTVIGFFGSFYSYEGLHLLLRALPEIRRQYVEAMVLLVGGGPEEGRLHQLARELDLRDGVVFVGRVPHDQIRRYYDLADLLAFPRVSMRLTDLVTPLKPLEAMAQERIVVASDVGGHRELIRDRETGYLIRGDDPQRLAEGIVAALRDRGSWPRIRARALTYIDRERSWAHSVERYAPVYDRLMHDR